MANKFAAKVEQMRNGETLTTVPEAGGKQKSQKVTVPTMSAVDETATVEDLDIRFDEKVERRLLREVEDSELSPAIKEIVQDDGVLGDRDLFTWKWEEYIFGEPLTLNCVPDEYAQDAQEAKTLMGIYITLIDDIGERHGDETTFWELAKTAYPAAEPDWDRDDIDSDYARSIKRVWTELMDRLRSAPRFEEFIDTLRFNLRETIQAMDYARLSDDARALMNPEETWHFDTQAIGLFVNWTVDLMYAPSFQMGDFREFRQVVYELQHMWRLGNWIITWEREVHEHDYSAGIFVEALDQGIIDETDLERLEDGTMNPELLINRIKESGIVERFISDWKRRRDGLYERNFEMESLDSNEMVKKMEWLMQSHLATEGHR